MGFSFCLENYSADLTNVLSKWFSNFAKVETKPKAIRRRRFFIERHYI